MSTRISKVVKEVGRCNEQGLSFHESEFLARTKVAFEQATAQVAVREGVTTGPAKVSIIIEQEFIGGTDDE